MNPLLGTFTFHMRRKDDRKVVTSHLSSCLSAGCLSLIVGAGVSRPFGLPGWPALLRHCLRAVGADASAEEVDDKVSGEELFRRADEFRREVSSKNLDYLEIVRSGLYGDTWIAPKSADATPLLRAVGCLAMGAQRGNVADVINYNFDCLLTWYLTTHGFTTQIVKELPWPVRRCDIRMWHPHGYLPFSDVFGRRSSSIIFDRKAATDFAADRINAWKDLYRFMFATRVFIAIGISGQDNLFRTAVTEAAQGRGNSPIGFWFHTDDADEHQIADMVELKFVPIRFPDHESYAPLLFDVCAGASAGVV